MYLQHVWKQTGELAKQYKRYKLHSIFMEKIHLSFFSNCILILYADREKYIRNYWPKVWINPSDRAQLQTVSQKQLQSNHLNCLQSADEMLISQKLCQELQDSSRRRCFFDTLWAEIKEGRKEQYLKVTAMPTYVKVTIKVFLKEQTQSDSIKISSCC